jgi:Gram-negative bacterial TonB protein C-terminal
MTVRARLSRTFLFLAALCGWALFSPHGLGAQQAGPERKLLQRTAPEYPPLARSMALQGAVKVEALVAPDGSVKSVEIKGGHPVLAQAAEYGSPLEMGAAAHESHEMVEVKFSPE